MEEDKLTGGQQKKIHQPEFIILEDDERQETRHSTESSLHQEYIELLKKLNQRKYSWSVRLMTFFGFFFLGILTLVLAFFAAISILIALISLFRSSEANEYMHKAVRQVKKFLVMTAGMFIGIFSPSLGLGLILLYFLMQGETLNKVFVSKVFSSSAEN
jgi:ABC-type multidrug transport system fused ATPase/permease subunit